MVQYTRWPGNRTFPNKIILGGAVNENGDEITASFRFVDDTAVLAESEIVYRKICLSRK